MRMLLRPSFLAYTVPIRRGKASGTRIDITMEEVRISTTFEPFTPEFRLVFDDRVSPLSERVSGLRSGLAQTMHESVLERLGYWTDARE